MSAGRIFYRINNNVAEVLIGHPGGPFWAKKDDGAWSIPKGEYEEGHDLWEVAQRDFHDEIGFAAPEGEPIEFEPLKQPSGKVITAFAVEGDLDVTDRHSNTFEMAWPKGWARCKRFQRSTVLAGSPSLRRGSSFSKDTCRFLTSCCRIRR